MLTADVRTIIPIVAIPPDMEGRWSSDSVNALHTAIDNALTWWAKCLGFSPFRPANTIAIGLTQPRATYTAAPNTQELIRAELATYYPVLAGQHPADRLYVVYAYLDDDPYQCPGDVIGTSAAAAGDPPTLIMQSSGSLLAFITGQNDGDPSSGSRDQQTGALAHELGHALGLSHPTDPTEQQYSIMWSWWQFPNLTLGPVDYRTATRTARTWQASPA